MTWERKKTAEEITGRSGRAVFHPRKWREELEVELQEKVMGNTTTLPSQGGYFSPLALAHFRNTSNF